MEQKVKLFIEQHRLLNADGLQLVALSGGADSVAMTLVLRRLGYHIEAVHCNFLLRGEESDRDELFVRDLCEEKGIALHTAHFETRSYARIHSLSIEMAARQLRYDYFARLRRDIGAETVCVAHNRDDVAETVLMNLIRGTGIEGLKGIPERNGYIRRPLLNISRKEIEQYLKSNGQPYNIDSTNLRDDVVRNKIRLDILPLLEMINPAARRNIAAAARHVADCLPLLDQATQQVLSSLCGEGPRELSVFKKPLVRISAKGLLSLPSAEHLFFTLAGRYGFTAAQSEQIFLRLDRLGTGRVFSSDEYDMVIDRGTILFYKRLPLPATFTIPMPGLYDLDEDMLIGVEMIMFPDSDEPRRLSSLSPFIATLNAARVSFPLTLRPALPGDRFFPFGMQGSKLVSDFLTDRKVPIIEKRRQRVVTDCDGKIIWVVGRQIDDHYRVDKSVKDVIRLILKKKEKENV